MSDTLEIPSEEFEHNFSRYRSAAKHQPVVVLDEGEDAVVLISMNEYRRLKRRDREVLRVEDLSDDDIATIEAAEPGPECAQFDHEFPAHGWK